MRLQRLAVALVAAQQFAQLPPPMVKENVTVKVPRRGWKCSVNSSLCAPP
jgi:hypothetical protein